MPKQRTREQIVAEFKDSKILYSELNSKANRVASVIINKFQIYGKTIGILVEHSFEMLIGLLAILKSGNTFVPLDYNLPIERINYIIQDSDIKILLHSTPVGKTVFVFSTHF